MIKIFLDNNVFDFLFEKNIDISKEFPIDKFIICIPREIKFESEHIKLQEKNDFVRQLIDKEIVQIHTYFGYYDDRHFEDKQRIGGYDEGEYMCVEEGIFLNELVVSFLDESSKHIKHNLYKQEGDIALAVRSVMNIVISNDVKEGKSKKKGPLNLAFDKGYRVVFLNGFVEGMSLNNYIKEQLLSRDLQAW
ncbi:hypothetical protein [Pseudofrancisella aestuarii]|nr:hypothetical protein [Pseudofrancisella aestuarii]